MVASVFGWQDISRHDSRAKNRQRCIFFGYQRVMITVIFVAGGAWDGLTHTAIETLLLVFKPVYLRVGASQPTVKDIETRGSITGCLS